MKLRFALGLTTLAVGVGGGSAALRAQTQVPATPYAFSGATAPDSGGTVFTLFNTPTINGSGFTAFAVQLSATASDDDAIYAASLSGTSFVARENSSAPGTGGAVFGDASGFGLPPLANPLVDDSGQVAFFARIRGTGVTFGVNDNGLWVGAPGSITLAARTGSAAPGTPANFSFVSETALIAAGQLAFRGALTGTGVTASNDTGIWSGTAGSIQLVAREGDAAPGTGAGVNYGGFNTNPAIASSGKVVFHTSLTGAVTASDDSGVWAGAPGSVQIVAREGSSAPGIGGGTFSQLSTLASINAAGTVAVQATVAGTGITASNNEGIWVGSGTADLQLLVREGTSAAGLSGIDYSQISQFVVMNTSGRVAFQSQLVGSGVDGTNNTAIFAGTVGDISRIVRKGDHAPGTPSGVNFAAFEFSVALNDGGQVAFIADLTGSGVVASNNRGIWALDPFGQIVKVAREGDTITVNTGDNRVVADFGLGMSLNSSGGEGRAASFNDASQVVYNAFFVDKTRAIVTSRVGGAARVKPTSQPPVFGPAVGHGYHLGTPAAQWETVNITDGDLAGYVKFSGYSVTGGTNLYIHLDFNGPFSAATDELNRGVGVEGYGYTVETSPLAGFDLMLTFAGANDGSDKIFYWNFLNLGVDLDRVVVTPEPSTGAFIAAGVSALCCRRRRR